MRAWLERHPALAACLAGVLVAAALPPVHFHPGLLGFGLLVALPLHGAASRTRAFARGTAFGFGFFLAGLYWVGIAFFADAERFGAFAVPAVLLLCLGLALTVGLAAAASWRRWRRPEAQALLFAVFWTLAELLRGDLGLQFPWNPIASVWAGNDLTLQTVAWLGTYGLSLVTVAAAGLTAALFRPEADGRRAAIAAPVLLVAFLLAAGTVRLAGADDAPTSVHVRVVQANVAQHHKWDPELRAAWFRRHLDLSQTPHNPAPDVIVWPESAVPYPIERYREVREHLAAVVPKDGLLLVGGDRYAEGDPPRANNSLFALDDAGAVVARYDKVDLVPFGEFMPFRPVLGRLGLRKLVEGTFDFVPGPGRVTLALPGLPPASPLICYEAIFPGRAVAADALRPRWLVNITNDAWFGTSSGPFQHLAMARMRAVEEGLPLVRAANTGISAVTDAYGRIRARLPLNEAGIIDAALPAALPAPAFARRAGPLLLPALVLIVALASLLVEFRYRKVAR